MAKTRALRLSDKDEQLIEAFLKENPFLDFSTLTRIAIRQFIENPSVTFKSVRQPKKGVADVRSGR
jgi:hypothetical protein